MRDPCYKHKFKSTSVQELDDRTQKEVDDMVNATNLFLASVDTKITSNQTLLGIKVIVDFRHQQIQKDFKENGEAVPTPPHSGPTSYLLKIEDAVDCLVLYEHFWIRSISIVLGNLSELPPSNVKGTRKDVGCQSSSSCTEVMLSILVNGPIDDKSISKREELKKFLKELKKKEVLKVHAICSSVAVEKKNPTYSFLVL